MRIWIVNVGEQIPSDPGRPRMARAGIMARTLAKRGHEVVWWNASVNHQEKIQRTEETVKVRSDEGYDIVLLKGRLYESNRSPNRIICNFENALAFRKLAPTLPKPDVILAGYPTIELTFAAIEFAKAHNIPCAADFRDMWPDIIVDELSPLKKTVLLPLILTWQWMQQRILKNATAIVGVTEGFMDWAFAKIKPRKRGNLDRVFHLAIDPETLDPTKMEAASQYWDAQGVVKNDQKIIACFVGALSQRYDLEALIDGAALLPEDARQKIQLVICGQGDMYDTLKAKAEGLPHVKVLDWRNAAEVRTLLNRSDIGLLPYHSTRDYIVHFPNKVGEYLSAGLGIATGLMGTTQDMLRTREIGCFYDEGNPESIKACLLEMAQNPARIRGMRDGALKAYEDMFNARKIYDAYADFIETLATQKA
jgi:glycosyltransferase involved in cell wall biosynthesis